MASYPYFISPTAVLGGHLARLPRRLPNTRDLKDDAGETTARCCSLHQHIEKHLPEFEGELRDLIPERDRRAVSPAAHFGMAATFSGGPTS